MKRYIDSCEACKTPQREIPGAFATGRFPDGVRGEEIGLITPEFIVRKGYRGKTAWTQTYIGGTMLGAANVKATAKCPDPEKLATLLSIHRALNMVGKYGVFLPPPSRAILKLAASLVQLRYDAMVSGNPNKRAKAAQLLEQAKRSPSRVTRAAAAALQELLK